MIEVAMTNTKYERLFNFLGSWFPDMDLEGISEKDIVEEYKKSVSKGEIQAMIFEAKGVLNEIEKYWRKMEHETNLYFENPDEAFLWLKLIVKLLEKNNK